jgi:hypothetical protein
MRNEELYNLNSFVYLTILSVSLAIYTIDWYDAGQIMNWKGFRRKQLPQNAAISPDFTKKQGKQRKMSGSGCLGRDSNTTPPDFEATCSITICNLRAQIEGGGG